LQQLRDRFLEKEVWEPNSGGFRISKWGTSAVGAVGAELGAEFKRRRREAPRGIGCGKGVSSSPLGESGCCAPSPEKNVELGSEIGGFLCKLGAFCTVHIKLLNVVPTVKITVGTPFPGVPAGNDPCNNSVMPVIGVKVLSRCIVIVSVAADDFSYAAYYRVS